MNLGQKTLLVVSLTVAGVMTVLYVVGRDVLLRSYLDLEQEQTRNAVARTEAALNDQVTNLTRTTNDYGAWDRTYVFMQHPSQSYIKQEFENDTLQGLRVNSILLTDTSQQVVFFKAYDSVENVEVRVPIEFQRALAADPWVQQATATSTPAHGILLLPRGPVLIAVCPILTTERLGPVRGALLMTRNLDGALVEGLRERTLLSVAIHLASSPSLPADVRGARKFLESSQEGVQVQSLNPASVAGYSLLRDVHGQTALLLRVEMPRSVFQRGLTSVRYLLVTLCIASVVFGVTTLLLLQRIVLARLTYLSAEVGRIGSGGSKDLSERIRVPGSDEIGRLGRDINYMLEALQKHAGAERMNEVLRQEISDRQLAEKAREESIRLTTLSANIGAALTKGASLRVGLQQSAEAFVQYLDVAFARVWTCNRTTNMLELEASAGMYTHIDGPHGRVPMGAMKIGRIAQSRHPHLTNDVLHDPQISNPEWAKREGMVAFAGYPLIVETQVVGVVAAFARQPMTKATLECFAAVADQLAQFIQRVRVQEALRASTEHFRQLFATIPIPVWLRDSSNGRFLEVNDAAVKHYGYSREQFLQMTIADILVAEGAAPPIALEMQAGQETILKQRHRTRDDRIIDVEANIHPVEFTRVPALLVAAQDVTERNQMAIELLHGQKLQAVGGLAAGVAHEINTPIQFVGDNVRFLHDAFGDLAKLLEQYEVLYQEVRGGVRKSVLAAVDEARQGADLEFLRKEIPVALDQTLDGIGRVATIVRALKIFSHVDSGSQNTAADLNSALESTIVVARNELKYLAEVETAFGDLPPVTCNLGDLNQVFLNLMLNAAHSIADVVKGTDQKGHIRVATHLDSKPDGDWADISISDTGTGIPEKVRERIFEPFFTTKPVGKGTGQGLALARAVVVEKHGGSLTFETEMGRGTTFHVRIPVNGIPSLLQPRQHEMAPD